MTLRRSGFLRCSLAVGVLVWGGLCREAARAGDPLPERPLPGKSSATQTNLSRALPSRPPVTKNGLMRLEEQISHAFQFLKPSSSPEELPTPLPVRPAAPVQSRRAKELQDQRKDWMLLNPSELTATPKMDELLNVPDYNLGGSKKDSRSSVERFYQDLDRRNARNIKGNAAQSAQQLRDELNASRRQQTEDPNLPSSIRDSESTLRKLLGLSSSPSTLRSSETRGGLSDIFGLGDSTAPSEEELKRNQAYLKEYHDWLNRSAAPAPSSGFASLPGVTDLVHPNAPAAGVWGGLAPLDRPGNYDPSIGAANPSMMVSSPQDITAKVLNQWNPLYSPPKVEPPKYEPPKPIFDVPRRKF